MKCLKSFIHCMKLFLLIEVKIKNLFGINMLKELLLKFVKTKVFGLALYLIAIFTSLLLIFSLIWNEVKFEINTAEMTVLLFIYNPFIISFIILLSLKISEI